MLKIELELIKEHHLEAIYTLANNPNISRTSGVPNNCQPEHVYSWIHSTHAPKSDMVLNRLPKPRARVVSLVESCMKAMFG